MGRRFAAKTPPPDTADPARTGKGAGRPVTLSAALAGPMQGAERAAAGAARPTNRA